MVKNFDFNVIQSYNCKVILLKKLSKPLYEKTTQKIDSKTNNNEAIIKAFSNI